MSIKLYSFRAKKQRSGKMNTDLNVQTTLTSMSLNRGFLLRMKMAKAVRMIDIKDITKRKEEELRLKLLETVIVQTKESILLPRPIEITNFRKLYM
jgi:hypothetical protein